MDYAPHISPICLPPKDMHLMGHYGWAAGWGALEPGSRLRPKTLQVVDVPMIDNRQCEQWHRDKGINVIIYDEMVCAGYFHGGKVTTHRYDLVEMTVMLDNHNIKHGCYCNL